MELKRKIDGNYFRWKEQTHRNPLVVFGARQVGKSHSIKRFAQAHCRDLVEVNFWQNPGLCRAFHSDEGIDLNPEHILQKLEIELERKINVTDCLIFFDEIQDCPQAYQALKFFKENTAASSIIASGSYLKLMLKSKDGALRSPVGSVEQLHLTPLDFEEYLLNASPILHEQWSIYRTDIENSRIGFSPIDESVHHKLLRQFYYYLFTGGLPEVVSIFLDLYKDSPYEALRATRKKQLDILDQYRNDLLKYAKSTDISKILKLFNNIPKQLNRYHEEPVRRYSFREISPSHGYRTLQSSFDYLTHAGLIIKNHIVTNVEHPLSASSGDNTTNMFKAFWFDVGLLQAALGIPPESIITSELGAYKGFIGENFVARELSTQYSLDLFAFRSSTRGNAAEIEFLIMNGSDIIPVEVKTTRKSRKSKSLQSYIKRYKPVTAFKLGPGNTGHGDGFVSLPIYLAGALNYCA